MSQPEQQLIFIGDPEELKTVTIHVCITPGLLKSLETFKERNGLKTMSILIRRAIRTYIGANSISEITEQEKPFMPRPRRRKKA